MGTHNVPPIATTSRTVTDTRVTGLLPGGADWAIASSQGRDARARPVLAGPQHANECVRALGHLMWHNRPGNRAFGALESSTCDPEPGPPRSARSTEYSS